MDCGQVRNDINAYIDGELEPMTTKRVERHIKDCNSCRREYHSLLKARQIIKSLGRVSVPDEISAGLRLRIESERQQPGAGGVIRFFTAPRFRALAAAAALITALGLGLAIRDRIPGWNAVPMEETGRMELGRAPAAAAPAPGLEGEPHAADRVRDELAAVAPELDYAESDRTATAPQPSARPAPAQPVTGARMAAVDSHPPPAATALAEEAGESPPPAESARTVAAAPEPEPAADPCLVEMRPSDGAVDPAPRMAAAQPALPPIRLPADSVAYGTRGRPSLRDMADHESPYPASGIIVGAAGASDFEFPGVDTSILAQIENRITIFIHDDFEQEYQRIKSLIAEAGGGIISEARPYEGENPLRRLLLSVPKSNLDQLLRLGQTVPGQTQMLLRFHNVESNFSDSVVVVITLSAE